MDLRTEKVYDALTRAFTELLKEKDFNGVTVSELCDRARVRRATFYKHFSDKYDFLQYLLGRMRDEIIVEARDKADFDDPEAYLHAFVDSGLDFVDKNRDLLLSLRNSGMVRQMLETLTEKSLLSDNSPFPFEDEIKVQFMIGGLNQCAEWWLGNARGHSIDEMRKRLYAIVDAYAEAVG